MINNNQILNILQWNARSLLPKIIEFYSFCTTNHTDIACICETFFADGDKIHRHPDYLLYKLSRTYNANEQRSGGFAVLIRKTIRHSLLISTKYTVTRGDWHSYIYRK